MNRKMLRIFRLVILIAIISIQAQAQPFSKWAGTASNIFLRMEQSTYASALSGAYTAVAKDENALFYNPAGLANINKGALALNHTQWFEDIHIDNLIFGYNFDRKLGFAFSAAHLWMPSIQGKNNLGEKTTMLNVSSSVAVLGLGYRVHSSFYAGLNVKYFTDNLAGFKADGLAVDAGIYMYLMVPGLTFGLSLQNFGSKLRYDVAQEDLPLTLRGGLAYKMPGFPFRISIDAVKSKDTDLYYAGGVEYVFARSFALRMGNQFRAWQALNPVFGAGFNIKQRYQIDYTFYSNKELGITHRVGFTFRFNIPATRQYFRFNTSQYITNTASRLIPPQNIIAQIIDNRLLIRWRKVHAARYNVYARAAKQKAWKKLNRHPLYANRMEFKKPLHQDTIYIVVTSVINNAESAFSEEAKLDVH